MTHRPELTLLDKTATAASWLIAGAMFLTVGWLAMAPDDPQGAVSVLARSGGLMMIVQAAALAAVTAGIATVIAGRRLADVGPFAAAIGLALVSLRGSTATSLLLLGAETSGPFERGLAMRFAAESVAWFVVVIIALATSAVVMRWCSGSGGPSSSPTRGDAPCLLLASGFDLPGGLFGADAEQRTPPAEGLKHTLTAVVAAALAMTILSSGLSSRWIQHGQACFVVAAAVCIGSNLAHRLVPVRSALWSILAVFVLALVGYAWALLRGAAVGSPAGVPSSHFLRVLPIQYISVGTAAAIAMFWSSHPPSLDTRRSASRGGRTAPRGGGA